MGTFNIWDIVLGALLLFGLIRGWMLGFIRQLFSLAGLLIALLGTRYLATPVATLLCRWTQVSENIVRPLSCLLLFLAILLLSALCARVLQKMVHWVRLGALDAIAGILCYELKIILIASLLINLYEIADPESALIDSRTRENSYLYPPIEAAAPAVITWVAEEVDWETWKPKAAENK